SGLALGDGKRTTGGTRSRRLRSGSDASVASGAVRDVLFAPAGAAPECMALDVIVVAGDPAAGEPFATASADGAFAVTTADQALAFTSTQAVALDVVVVAGDPAAGEPFATASADGAFAVTTADQ